VTLLYSQQSLGKPALRLKPRFYLSVKLEPDSEFLNNKKVFFEKHQNQNQNFFWKTRLETKFSIPLCVEVEPF
jgi:hypothetical protein